MRSRVMPGSSPTIERRVPRMALNRVDLPTLGRPTMTMEGSATIDSLIAHSLCALPRLALALQHQLIEGVQQRLTVRIWSGPVRARLDPCLRHLHDMPVLPVDPVPKFDRVIGGTQVWPFRPDESRTRR